MVSFSYVTHQDVGQMDMYVRMYDDLKRSEGDNLFAAKYMPLMPTEEELRREIERQKELYRLQQEKQ